MHLSGRISWKIILLMLSGFFCFHDIVAQLKSYSIHSPDKTLTGTVEVGEKISVVVMLQNTVLMSIPALQMELRTGEIIGDKPVLINHKIENFHEQVAALNYKKQVVNNEYQQLTLSFRGKYEIIFRLFNDGLAYRFKTARRDSLTISKEDVLFEFNADDSVYAPYVNSPRNKDIFVTSFENTYTFNRVTEIKADTLSFMPVMVVKKNKVKIAITEADLEDYPGMFLRREGVGFKGIHAPFPVVEKKAGTRNTQTIITKRGDYIARTTGNRSFPWRVFIVSDDDAKLLDSDMVYRLASPSRISDTSWIKPGKVAWDWWNNWNLSGVDFKAGVNTQTYKYFIDFASSNGIEYILLDEGWAINNDLFSVIPEIDLKEIIAYGKSKNVGIWIWAGWVGLNENMEAAISTYSKMGVVGFKVDFMDRDDQKMVQFYYRLAETAARNKMMLDLHGAYKPTGLQRTYPNILNFEGVHGLENTKWSNPDFPGYDCTVPFIRMLAGPMDYTPGAMKNANKVNFRSVYASPMSQGTRCHQLALYVLYESPLSMLADSPTHYQREEECTTFISRIPTTFDQTNVLQASIGNYALIARRKNEHWYIGGITNWNSRELSIDLSFLVTGEYSIEIFHDGINADREATDYKRVFKTVNNKDSLTISLAAGGGWAAIISPIKKN